MGSKEVVFCSSLVIIFSLLLAYFNIWGPAVGKKHVDLAVCILSARDNFQHRNTIRRSWLTDTQILNRAEKSKSVVAKFVVGKTACSIHPQDRLDSHGCERWVPKLPEEETEVSVFMVESSISPTRKQIVQSIYVKVMQDIILKRVGLVAFFPLEKLNVDENVQVVLYDAVTEGEIAAASYTSIQKGVHSNGYFYRPVQEFHLPKGYEFTLEVVMPDNMAWSDLFNEQTGWGPMSRDEPGWNIKEGHHNIIVVKMLSKDESVQPKSKSSIFVPAVSFIFSIHDKPSLQQHLASVSERDLLWKTETNNVVSQLLEEQTRHDDLIMVDVIDIYRNLPDKLLLCHEWFHQNYNARHLLKTDDDCFLSLVNIVTELQELDNDLMWWGNFRVLWPVERHGKWRESDYTASIYPKFACGSANVVSNRIHEWLVQNKHSLKKFQGEDVSMGIWLSAVEINYLQDSRWRCDMSCQQQTLSLPELNPDMIWWHWNNSKICSSPCSSC